jgi:hypothetical protein
MRSRHSNSSKNRRESRRCRPGWLATVSIKPTPTVPLRRQTEKRPDARRNNNAGLALRFGASPAPRQYRASGASRVSPSTGHRSRSQPCRDPSPELARGCVGRLSRSLQRKSQSRPPRMLPSARSLSRLRHVASRDRIGDTTIARSGAPGAVPDDRDCPRGAHRRRRSRGCLCPQSAAREGSSASIMMAASLQEQASRWSDAGDCVADGPAASRTPPRTAGRRPTRLCDASHNSYHVVRPVMW